MQNETRQLLRASSIYSIGNILVKIVAFILIPLYANMLTTDEFGVVGVLELYEQLGKIVLSFGLAQAILRFFTQYNTRNKLNEFIISIFIFLLIANLVILGVLFNFSALSVKYLLTLTPENLYYFQTTTVIIFCGIFQALLVTLLQAEEKAIHFVIFSLFNFFMLIAFNIYKVGFLDQGITGIVESKLYVALFNLIITIVYGIYRFRPGFSKTILQNCLRYSFPLIYVGISLTVLTMADRYLLKELGSFSDAGIYSMAYKFGMILNMALITPFRQALFPLMFRLYEDQDIKSLYRKFLTYFLFCGLWFCLGLSLFAKEIMMVSTSPEFEEGYVIIPLITLSYLLFGVRCIFVNALATQKQTKIIAYSTMIGAVVNIILNIFIIPIWGIMGAAATTLLSYLLITVTTYIPQQRAYPVNWDISRTFKLFLLSLLLYAGIFITPGNSLLISIFWKCFLLMLFPVVLYLIKFFQPTEIGALKKIAQLIFKKS